MLTLSATQWLQLVGLGGLMGAIGQMVRMVVSIKQLNDIAGAESAAGNPVAVRDLIETHRLVVSLAIGFVSGAMAAIATSTANIDDISGNLIAGWIAAGYAGADFIEGFMARATPSSGAPILAPAASPESTPTLANGLSIAS